MVVSLKANKKRVVAFLVLAAIVVGVCVFLRMGKGEAQEPQQVFGETNEERLAYLQSFGWQVEAQASETREVMIPAEFNDVYTAYNAMQQAQGFDLRPYAGQVCTQYKYKITNYPDKTEVYATMLVYGRLVIGGDVACAEVDGFMHGFAPDSARYGETPATQNAAPEKAAPQSQAEAASAAPAEDMEESAAQSSVESTAGELLPEDAFPID